MVEASMRSVVPSPRALSALVVLATAALVPLASESASAESELGQFVIRCPYSHTLHDDPIVAPGLPGVSHSHDFFGNVTVNAGSTMETMLGGETTCRVPSDTAGYWSPTAYLNGLPITPTVMRVYYLGNLTDNVERIPPGLQIIGGNKDAVSPDQNLHVRWSCGETAAVKTPREETPYDCSPWAVEHAFVDGVIAIVDLPTCWNGVGLRPDSVVYPTGGTCPIGFRHRLPRISERVHFGVMNPIGLDGSVALTLSSGPYWTFHSDFWNTWQQDRLDQLVQECLVARVHCGAVDAAGQVDWTRQFGTTRYDLAYAAAADGTGMYVAGFTNYALEGETYHRRYDAFVRRYDADGNVAWTRQFGTHGTDQALALVADDEGVTVAGSTEGRLPGQERNAGGVDAFVARFDPSGEPLWLRQFGTRRDDRVTAVAGGSGATFVAGSTGGALGERRGGPSDAFVARLRPSGDTAWIQQFGTAFADEVAGLASRGGVLYAVGWTRGGLGGDFAGGISDAFAAAVDSEGTPLWQAQLGTAGTDRAAGIVARARGLFVVGSTDGALPEQTSSGAIDAFVAKVGLDGSAVWFRQFGSVSDDEAVAVAADRKGVYVAGSAAGALPDGELLGESDGFVRRYLPNGTQIWTRQLGTTDYDRVYGLAVEPSGLYLVGTTHGVFDGQVFAGDRDVFVLRLGFS